MGLHFDSYICINVKCSDFSHQETMNALDMKASVLQCRGGSQARRVGDSESVWPSVALRNPPSVVNLLDENE